MKARLFVALELPASVAPTLAEAMEALKARAPRDSVRWARPAGIHLTLKFYGEVKPAIIPALQTALSAAVEGHAPMALTLQGLGMFPNAVAPRVVWAGLAGELEQVRVLQKAIEQGAAALGFAPEKRAFTPHLTLGRVTEAVRPLDRSALAQAVKTTALAPVAFTATEVSLMQSDLRPTGAVYTRLFAARLHS